MLLENLSEIDARLETANLRMENFPLENCIHQMTVKQEYILLLGPGWCIFHVFF